MQGHYLQYGALMLQVITPLYEKSSAHTRLPFHLHKCLNINFGGFIFEVSIFQSIVPGMTQLAADKITLGITSVQNHAITSLLSAFSIHLYLLHTKITNQILIDPS